MNRRVLDNIAEFCDDKNRSRRALVTFTCFAIIGIIAIAISKAAGTTLDLEAESGSRSGNVSATNDLGGGVSGNAYIRFGASTLANNQKRFFADTASFNKKAVELGFTGGTLNTKYSGNMFDFSGI